MLIGLDSHTKKAIKCRKKEIISLIIKNGKSLSKSLLMKISLKARRKIDKI